MLRIPLCWNIPYKGIYDSTTGQYVSEKKLNNEWKIVCIWKENILEPQSLKICRQNTSEEIMVSGKLILVQRNLEESTQNFLKLIESGSLSVIINFNIIKVNPCIPTQVKPFPRSSLFGFINIISTKEISDTDFENGEGKKCILPKSLEQLSCDFEMLLNPLGSCFADVDLKCGSLIIPAHKIILSARSPVFEAMFRNSMKENCEQMVDIYDMDVYALRILLTYIYTGRVSNLTVWLASNLLIAADKYQLQDLKRVCCDFLKDKVSVHNVLRFLVLGEMYAKCLKIFTVDYICNKVTDFLVLEKTQEWKTLRKERPALANNVLMSLVKSRGHKSKG